MTGPSASQPDWADLRKKVEDLYWTQDKELPEVMKIMKSLYGFVATKKMYKKHLKAWGLEKNLKTTEAVAMLKIAEQRRAANKDTNFIRRGKPVEPGKLRRFAKRHKFRVDSEAAALSDLQVATPPNITYTTPEPNPSSHSLPPAPQPYPALGKNTDGWLEPEDSAGSSGFESDGSPPIRTLQWAPPDAVVAMSGSTYAHSRGSAHIGLNAHFVQDAFSGYQLPAMAPDFAHDNIDTTFPTSRWPNSVNPSSHGYQDANSTSDCAFVLMSPQPMFQPLENHSIDCGMPGFPNHTSPALNTLIPGMSDHRADSLIPADATFTIPNAARSALDHTALHDAVVANLAGLARSLLESGANPNCAARGGMTPLHYAAYQRSVELVTLLLDYGADLDVMTDKKRSVLFFAVRSRGRLGNSDMFAYASQNCVGNGSHTDEATMRVLHALYDSPSGWIRLRRCFDKADKDGVTPLMVAAEEGFEETVRLLLRRGAQPDVKDHASHTALKYAASSNHRPLVRLLLEADPGILDRDLSHLLKLANKNLTIRSAVNAAQGNDGQDGRWDVLHISTSSLIAEEMVQLCRERGLLDGLLALATQRRKADVLDLLLGAVSKLDMERQGNRDFDVS